MTRWTQAGVLQAVAIPQFLRSFPWPKRPDRPQRVIVLVLAGFDHVLAQRLMDDGLLHYLPLLSDIGARTELRGEGSLDLDALAAALRAAGKRVALLASGAGRATDDLGQICADDRAQQEHFFALLRRRRPGVVVGKFEMLERIRQLFGPNPTADQRLVFRDVHARMDEVVGKAISFVDATTALIVAIPQPAIAGSACGADQALEVFVSRAIPASENRMNCLAELVNQLHEAPASQP